jgi:hypothetical protein
MVCTYVKEFKFAEGGSVDLKQDKAMIKTAVHKHEKAQHAGKPLTKLKAGGPVVEKATGESYSSRKAMMKHEKEETPRMQREELIQRSKVVAPARRSVPVAPAGPMIALKCGGKVKAR